MFCLEYPGNGKVTKCTLFVSWSCRKELLTTTMTKAPLLPNTTSYSIPTGLSPTFGSILAHKYGEREEGKL